MGNASPRESIDRGLRGRPDNQAPSPPAGLDPMVRTRPIRATYANRRAARSPRTHPGILITCVNLAVWWARPATHRHVASERR